jgi:two-component system chemotaxis response regulator CheY
MVIDDSRAIRMILGRCLTNLGYEVHPAGNGREALQVLEKEAAGMELALVDWNMPEMAGIDFVREARRNPCYDNIVLIMVTTETETEQMIAALEAGANEYIMKPFTEDMIAEKVRMVAAARELAGESAR